MIISIPTKAKEKFIALCQATKDAKTEREFNLNRIKAEAYSSAIEDICGLSVWANIVMCADLEIGSDEYGTCCGVPLLFNKTKDNERQDLLSEKRVP